MSINTKNKRKITCQGKDYYWHVVPDYDNPELTGKMLTLRVIAEDKSLVLTFPLDSSLRDPAKKTIPAAVPDVITPETVQQLVSLVLSENESRS